MTSHGFSLFVLLVACLPWISSAEDTWHFVEIGGPPWIAAQPLHARTIHDLTVYQGRLYLSYGNAGTNDGPVEIGCYDPASHTFITESLLGSEAIGRIKVIGDELYVPSVDPAHFYNQSDFAVRSRERNWKHHRQIGMLHAYDISVLSDTLILSGSSRDIRSGTGANTLSWLSMDEGLTWQPLLRTTLDPRAHGRSRYAIPFQDRIHFSGKIYNGEACEPFDGDALAIAIDAYTDFRNAILYTHGTPGEFGSSSTSMLELFDGNVSMPVNEVIDFTVHQDEVWILKPGPLLESSKNLSEWRAWNPSTTSTLPGDAHRLAFVEDNLYVGTRAGTLWRGIQASTAENLPAPDLTIKRDDGSGTGLAVLPGTTVIGVPASGTSPWNEGHVRLEDHATGANRILKAPDPSALAYFGAHVAGTGDWIAVSEPKRREAKVHFYQYDDIEQSWQWRQTLSFEQKRSGQSQLRPLHSLAMTEGLLVIGWEGEVSHAGDPAFSLYQHEGDQWQVLLEVPLDSFVQDLDSEAYVQASVALTENILAVGITGDSGDNKGQGLAALYRRQPETGRWDLLERLMEPQPEMSYGASVAIDDNWLAIGAPRGSGMVFLYRIPNGELDAANPVMLESPEPDARFGHALALAGGQILIGAPETDWNRPASGRAYLYQLTSAAVTLTSEFASDKPGTRGFGNAVDMLEDCIAIGSTSGDVRMIGEPFGQSPTIQVELQGKRVVLRWPTVIGNSYIIQETRSLTPPSWQPYKTVTPTADTHTESIPIENQNAFFRIVPQF